MIMPPHPGMIDMDNLIILLKVIAVQVLLLVVRLLIQQNTVLVVVLHGEKERGARTLCPFFLRCILYMYTPFVRMCVCKVYIYILYMCECVCVCVSAHGHVWRCTCIQSYRLVCSVAMHPYRTCLRAWIHCINKWVLAQGSQPRLIFTILGRMDQKTQPSLFVRALMHHFGVLEDSSMHQLGCTKTEWTELD